MTTTFYKRFSFYLIFLATIAFNNAHSSGQPDQSMKIPNPTYEPWEKLPTYTDNNPLEVFLYAGKKDRPGQCYTAAVMYDLGCEPEDATKLKISSCTDLVRLGILDRYYRQVEQPFQGNIAVFVDPKGNIQHFANVIDPNPDPQSQECTVLSKLGNLPPMVKHGVFRKDFSPYVPSTNPIDYGNTVFFYNRKDEFQNNQKTLAAIQYDIQCSFRIQRDLSLHRNSLLSLANGNDIPFCNQRVNAYPLHDKAWFLLKRCTGLEVDSRDSDGNTPLSLAAKQGNTQMIETLLMMGANKSLKNKQGLTALDLAEETCMTKIQDPQFSSRDWSKYQATIKVLTL